MFNELKKGSGKISHDVHKKGSLGHIHGGVKHTGGNVSEHAGHGPKIVDSVAHAHKQEASARSKKHPSRHEVRVKRGK